MTLRFPNKDFYFYWIVLLVLLTPSCSHSISQRSHYWKLEHSMQGMSQEELQSIYRRLEHAGFQPGNFQHSDLRQLSSGLRAFQQAEGLEMTGVFDAPTREQLQQLPDPQRAETPPVKPPTETRKTWALTGLIRLLQHALRELGYRVVVNDTLDETTREAIAQFQQQYELPADALLTSQTAFAILDAWCYQGCEPRILIQATSSPTDHDIAPVILHGENWETVAIQGMQKLLMAAEYNPGPPDGRLTPRMQAALRQFRQTHRLDVNAEVFDQATMLALLGEGCAAGCAAHLFVNTQRPSEIPPTPPDSFDYLLQIASSPSSSSEALEPNRLTPASPVQLDPRQYPLQVGKRAFAVEKFECSDISGDWALLYEGAVEQTDANTTVLRLEKRFGYRYHPDKEGIDNTDWWCIPGRRHCYSEVEFADWGGKYLQHQTARFPTSQVYQAEIGIINSMDFFLQQACPRQNDRHEESTGIKNDKDEE